MSEEELIAFFSKGEKAEKTPRNANPNSQSSSQNPSQNTNTSSSKSKNNKKERKTNKKLMSRGPGKNIQCHPVRLIREFDPEKRLSVSGQLLPSGNHLGPDRSFGRSMEFEKFPQGHTQAPKQRFRKQSLRPCPDRSSRLTK
jgi:hypothetical protein